MGRCGWRHGTGLEKDYRGPRAEQHALLTAAGQVNIQVLEARPRETDARDCRDDRRPAARPNTP